MKTITEKEHYRILNLFGEGFRTGDFSKVYPLLAKSCKLESWTGGLTEFNYIDGKDKIIDFFNKKEKADFVIDEVVYGLGDRIRAVMEFHKNLRKMLNPQGWYLNEARILKGSMLTMDEIELLPVNFYRRPQIWLQVSQFFDSLGDDIHRVIIKLFYNNSGAIKTIAIHAAPYYEFCHYKRDSEERKKTRSNKTDENLLSTSDLTTLGREICQKQLLKENEKMVYSCDGAEMPANFVLKGKKDIRLHYCVYAYLEGQGAPLYPNNRLRKYRLKKAALNDATLFILSVGFSPKSKKNKKLYLNSKYNYHINGTFAI